MRPVPYVLESIERDGEAIYRHQPASIAVTSVDRAAFYQLKSMMQGVLARGTARSIASLAPYVAGKTGTSDNENDAWFVGFTNDVTVAVWLGYDNADGKRTLGGGATGGGVAVPIFEPVIEAAWAYTKPRVALAPPSPEAKQHLSCKSVDRSGASTECLRTDAKGKIIDAQYRLISQAHAYAKPDREDGERKGRRVSEESSREARREARSERAVVERSGYARRSEWSSGARGSLPSTHSDYGRPW
jgi:membrane carboxypeptidase/penicillin-binding protein